MALLTALKGLPLAYNKDMQEDKEAVFDAIDTVKKCLSVFAPMIRTMKPLPENMYAAAQKGFINATDLADYLVKKGLPFRTAYKLVGQAIAKAIELGKALDQLPLETLKQFSPPLRSGRIPGHFPRSLRPQARTYRRRARPQSRSPRRSRTWRERGERRKRCGRPPFLTGQCPDPLAAAER